MSVPIDLRGLAVLLLDAAVLAAIVLNPFRRNYDDSDKGEGSLVVLRPPLKPSYARCGAFLAISVLVTVLMVGVRQPNLGAAYHWMVTELLLSVIPDPSVVDAFARSLIPVFQVSVIAFGVAFAVAFRASLGRRFIILLHVGLFLIVSVVVDAFFGVFVLKTGFPLGPTPVISLLMQYTIAGVVVCRLAFTSFQLPRKTQLPLYRTGNLMDDAITVICTAAAFTVTIAGAIFLIDHLGRSPLVAALIAFSCPPYIFILIIVFMGLVRLVHRRQVDPTSERPPIEVIIPAFNEELNIADLMRSLDRAAERYEGPVRVILCDDGSTDDTRLLAAEAMLQFRFATGEIVEGAHTGKSGALNSAFARCTADYVIRIDADCIAHPDCFLYAVPYFLQCPEIGMVGAFILPKEPYATWIDRMRLFELLTGFGMNRPSAQVVDGIACIPGTFTAFRREAGLRVGGFVEGMYGEDLDFTLAVARLGYRTVVDTRVRTYEDVPNTQRQLRIQRTRWSRGGSMCFARYVPVVTGFGGPRYWFFMFRSSMKRFLTPLNLTTYLYFIVLAIMSPTTKLNLARVFVALAIKSLPAATQVVGCAIYYRRWKTLGWLPLRYPFTLLKHYYGLEAFLSFNPRPVLTPRVREALSPQRAPAPALEPTPVLEAEVA